MLRNAIQNLTQCSISWIFSTGVQIYKGTLKKKCVLNPTEKLNETELKAWTLKPGIVS